MADDLNSCSVPPLYRTFYDALADYRNTGIEDKLLLKFLLNRSSQPADTITSICRSVACDRDTLLVQKNIYSILAKLALAQQKKNYNVISFAEQDVPVPELGDLSTIKAQLKHIAQELQTPPTFNFNDQGDMEGVKIDVIPEKKGLIIKHVEYEVYSKKFGCNIRRRFNDFVALHELLLLRFPYRMIPSLPPKRYVGADASFIEQRRKSLTRFLHHIVNHPAISDDKIVHFFFTYAGTDLYTRIKIMFKSLADEYMTSEVGGTAKDLIPPDSVSHFGRCKEQIRHLSTSLMKLRELAERMVTRSDSYAMDMLSIRKELNSAVEGSLDSEWATGNCTIWKHLAQGFQGIHKEFVLLSEKSAEQARNQENGILEKITLLCELVSAYKDLCERHEKGVLSDHQRAVSKMMNVKKKRLQATFQSTDPMLTDRLESRILEQESEILNMENRNYFALHCIRQETRLLNANMELLCRAFNNLVHVEKNGLYVLAKVWSMIKPLENFTQGLAINSNHQAIPKMSSSNSSLTSM